MFLDGDELYFSSDEEFEDAYLSDAGYNSE